MYQPPVRLLVRLQRELHLNEQRAGDLMVALCLRWPRVSDLTELWALSARSGEPMAVPPMTNRLRAGSLCLGYDEDADRLLAWQEAPDKVRDALEVMSARRKLLLASLVLASGVLLGLFLVMVMHGGAL